MLNPAREEGRAVTLMGVWEEFKSAVKTINVFIEAGVKVKAVVFHSINLPQQEKLEKKVPVF